MTSSDAPPVSAPPSAPLSSDGEPPRVHQPRRALPTDIVRPTRAEVHLSHLRHNLGVLRRAAPGIPLWAVLKADGYGHGAKAVARTLERAGADGICVALVEEGVELREAGIRLPILVMGGYYGNALQEISHYRLTPVLSDREQVESIVRAVSHCETGPLAAHVKVDTGMARLGARQEDWAQLVKSLQSSKGIELAGLMTHLAQGDASEAETIAEPLRLFAQASELFEQAGLKPACRHMANTAGLLRDARTHFDLVRPGIGLFGVNPLANLPATLLAAGALEGRLKPTMSVSSRIVSLRTLKSGDQVGYSGAFTATRTTRVATVPMGYADGLSRLLSNRGSVLVDGKRAPIIGNVSMDMTMVDVTEIEGVHEGHEVVFLGPQKGRAYADCISVDEVAAWSQTIPWEVLTNISRRVPRFYREA